MHNQHLSHVYQGIYPRGFLMLIPKGPCVVFIMAVFTEDFEGAKKMRLDIGMDNQI